MTSQRSSNPAFVLSLFDTGLCAVRALAREGVQVIGFDHDARSSGFSTKYCERIRIPDPRQPEGSEQAIEALIRTADRFREKPVLIPASDLYVEWISRNRERLASRFLFLLPEEGLLERLLDKNSQAELASSAGVLIPASWSPGKNPQARMPESMRYPVFVKPSAGTAWKDHYSVKGFLAHERTELDRILDEIRQKDLEVIVQEVIPGRADRHFEASIYVDSKGEASPVFVMKKLRQFPSGFGVGTWGESVSSPEVERLTLQFCKSSGLKGFANIEFKQDERDGRFFYIETNARIWQQLSLAEACGLNFAMMQYDDLTGRKSPTQGAHYSTALRWIDPIPDLQSYIAENGGKNLRDWIRNVKQAKVRGVYDSKDLGPFFRSLSHGIKLIVLARDVIRARFLRRSV